MARVKLFLKDKKAISSYMEKNGLGQEKMENIKKIVLRYGPMFQWDRDLRTPEQEQYNDYIKNILDEKLEK